MSNSAPIQFRQDPLAAIPFKGPADLGALTLGRLPDEAGVFYELRDASETHVLLFGPNGSGKMSRVLVPNLLRLQDRSVFVIDPKGELAAITAPQRRKYGEVIIINPFGVHREWSWKSKNEYADLDSRGFNPMMTLDPSLPSFNADAALLAEALIKVESQTQPYFDKAARDLVAMAMMYVAFALYGKDTPTLGRVRDLLTDEERLLRLVKVIQGMRRDEVQNPNLRGMINKAASFREITDPIRSVLQSAHEQLSFIDDTEMADDLARSTVDFREVKKRPTTVYLILPADKLLRHARWLRVVVASALNVMLRARRQGEPRVLFMMDEFPALGHMEIIEATWALVRGYGIQMMPVFQDLPQLNDIYEKRTDSFMQAAGAIAHLPPNDPTTIKWIMDRAGEKKQIVLGYNSGQSMGRETSTSRGRNWSTERVPRWGPLDLYGMQKYCMLLSLAGERNMIQTIAPHYWRVGAYQSVARRNPYVEE